MSLAPIVRDWSFVASTPTLKARLGRARALIRSCRRAPTYAVLKPLTAHARWTVLFVYVPGGCLTPAHYFTLGQLAARSEPLLVVCAAKGPGQVPAALHDQADALIWKGLTGFDFSAYAIALRAVAAHSPGADVLAMNDSVLGPFGSLDRFWADARWALSGFTASAAWENHLQSYAFLLRAVTPERVAALGSVLPRQVAFDHFQDVVFWQETRLARVAARTMSVGAWWYTPDVLGGDLPLFQPLDLVEQGFPFIKRSHFGKWRGVGDAGALARTLRRLGHPVPEGA